MRTEWVLYIWHRAAMAIVIIGKRKLYIRVHLPSSGCGLGAILCCATYSTCTNSMPRPNESHQIGTIKYKIHVGIQHSKQHWTKTAHIMIRYMCTQCTTCCGFVRFLSFWLDFIFSICRLFFVTTRTTFVTQSMVCSHFVNVRLCAIFIAYCIVWCIGCNHSKKAQTNQANEHVFLLATAATMHVS